jgi:Domain of unknown function (DUF4743)
MSFLDRIRECNAHDLARFRRFLVAGEPVGWLRHEFADRLQRFTDVFMLDGEAVTLDPGLGDFWARSDAVAHVLGRLAEAGAVRPLRGEHYPVATSFQAPPLLQLDRAAVPNFGVAAYGVHMNGFVRRPDGIHMWIARRSRDKATYPGELDNLVAGGQPIGIGLRENLIKECGEEAAIPPEIAAKAVAVGAVSYVVEGPDGLKPDTMFNYDLELDGDFEPRNTDGEVEAFYLLPVERVAAIVRDSRDFKFNCNLVIIDFLIRHGLIGPEHSDYLALVAGLHR